MTSFAAITRPHDRRLDFPPESCLWSVNGGYLAAAMLRAAAAVSDQPRIVAQTVDFIRPVQAGGAVVEPRPIAAAAGADLVEVDMLQHDRLCARARVWLAAEGDGMTLAPGAMPLAPHPLELRTLEEVLQPGEPPVHPFWRIFDQRPINRQESKRRARRAARLQRWFRLREELPPDDRALWRAQPLIPIDTMGLVAACEPQDGFRPPRAVTTSLSVHYHLPLPADGWMLCDARAPFAGSGSIVTEVDIWSLDGALIAQGTSHMLIPPDRPAPRAAAAG